MTPAARERVRIRVPLLAISAGAWLLLALDPHSMTMPMYCATATLGVMPSPSSIATLVALNPPASFAAGWAVMLAAMMVPTLLSPVRHVYGRSFARRRFRAVTLFAIGYGAVWTAIGVSSLELALVARLVVPIPLMIASAAVLALLWQISPAKQRCLNRCHAQPALSAFGTAADADALRFGLTQGMWCAGSCWALMLLPIVLVDAHVAAMAAVALWVAAERFEKPAAPRWRVRVPVRGVRVAI